MLYGRYTFDCQIDENAILPTYKGSTFRGVFGHALKHVTCALKQQECERCLLVSRCLYPFVFETHLTRSTGKNENVSSPPHPVVICPDTTKKKEFGPGESLPVTLTLLGKVNENLPYFIYAFQEMGRRGVGKTLNGKRARFTLSKVTHRSDTVFSSKTGRIQTPALLPELFFSNPSEKNSDSAVLKVKVNFETPMRIKFEKDIPKAMDFETLVRHMLRRMSSLLNHHGSGEPRLDYKGMIERSRSVRIIENTMAWLDWQRYSSRQDKKMFMGGFTGSVVYEGAIGEYLHLLDFCSRVHVGKNTVFGLGKISCEIMV
jgi:hypothetical protein